MKFKYMSGVKPTGNFHLGNFANIIKPIIDENLQEDTVVLIAYFHALTSDNKRIKKDTINIYNILKSFGINNVISQSEIPELCELYWLFSCYTAKGLLNRSHSYKVHTETNIDNGYDKDRRVFMGAYTYPVLMTADLVMFNSDYVFIGDDQRQHVNIANEIISKFNYVNHTDMFKVPKAKITSTLIEGFDGRKMSKSYGNTIPLFCSEEQLKKHINKVKTNSKLEGVSKKYNETPLTSIFDLFGTDRQVKWLKEQMKNGMSWKDVKMSVFDVISSYLKPYRKRYESFTGDDYNNRNIDEYRSMAKDRINDVRALIF